MAEEIKYIPYGTEEIDYNQFLLNSANEVQNYVNLQPWSRKRKESFLNAYKELMTQGITGASNDSGVWRINYNGNQIDLDSKSRIDREMYGEAAYFIQQQMSSLPTKLKQLEEENKNKSLFDNNYFRNSFHTLISNSLYGGLGFTTSEWNKLDTRGENGLLNINNRAELLASLLETYANSLKEEDLDFKDSPFENLNDFKTRVGNAVQALRSGNSDSIRESLNRLGLNYDNYFYNGSEDPFKKDLYEGTYGDYYGRYLSEQEKLKLEAELKKLQQKKTNQYTNFKFFGSKMHGKLPTGENYNNSINYLNTLAKKSNLTPDEQSEIVGLFKFAGKNGALLNLTKEELEKFGSGYTNHPTRIKKIAGVDGLYWDSIGNRVIQPYNLNSIPQADLQNILNLNTPEAIALKLNDEKQKAMAAPIDWSNLDEASKNELWAVVNDIVAFADPEAITGTAFALNASRLRDKNRLEGWSWERGLDWLTSSLGGLPILGDALSVYKAGSNLVKLANRSARIGSIIAAAFSAANLPEAWDSMLKIVSKGISSMTPQDIQNITYGLMGFAAGWKTINSVNARSKPLMAKEHSVEIDGKKVKLDESTAKKVESEYKQAKNNKEASDKVVKMLEVREAAKKAGIELTETSKITSGSGILRGNKYSRKAGLTKSPVSSTEVPTGEMATGATKGYYMPRTRKSFLNKYSETVEAPKFSVKKVADWFLGKLTAKPTETAKPKETSKSKEETSKTAEKPKEELNSKTRTVTKENVSKMKEKLSNKQTLKELRNFKNSNPSSNSSLEIKPGEIKIGDVSIEVGKKVADKTSGNKEKVTKLRESYKRKIESLLNSSRPNKEELKKIKEELLKAKKLGWWKQGGKIESSLDAIIEDFLNK